jgi:hypothetical protein
MGVNERDPRDIGFIALFRAITWYCDITPEAALRIVAGQSHAKPGIKLTPEALAEIKKIIQSPNHKNINAVVRRFRVNKYEIYKALSGREYTDEEVIIVPKIEAELKKLKDKAENCSAGNCDNCVLNTIMFGESTLCEILEDIKFDSQGKLVPGMKSVVYQKYTKSTLKGETKTKSFKLYKSAIDEFEKFLEKHKDEKIQDIASAALLEYVERHKRV